MPRRGLLVAALVFLFPAMSAASPAPGRTAAMAAAVADGFSGAVLVAEQGSIVLDGAYGAADAQTPNRTTTAFRAGALSRLFVTTAVLMLAEKGKLGLDNTAEQFVPGAGPATVRDLLADEGATPVLARVLAAASHRDLADVLNDTMFSPLWMTATALDDGRPSHRIATDNRGGPPPADWMAVTTTRDLLRWTDAFFEDRLVTAADRRLLPGSAAGEGNWSAASAGAAIVVRPGLTAIVLSNGGPALAALAARLAQP